MMKKLLLLVPVFAISAMCTFAQFTENFTDGDITTNPAWVTGNAADWVVTAGQLQSNNTTASSSFYLSTPSILATTAQWEFYTKLTFNTSSTNYVDVFLIASATDLSATATNGFFVRIGNTADEISLYRKDGATSTKIIDGVDATTNTSSNTIRIKVIRDASNQWILSRDLTGGTNYTVEGSVTDAAYPTSNSFGFFVKQSTASFFQRHFFDDINVQTYAPDVTAPVIQSSTVLSSTALDVLFNEPLDATTANTIGNYSVNNSIGAPATAVLDGSNSALVHLTFTGSFADAVANQLTVNGVKDISGNAISNGTSAFTYFAPYIPKQYDVVIDEIMADESPVVGLPAREWIELKNTTTKAITITGWKIKDGTGISGAFPTYTLNPGAYVILCSSTAAPDLATYGATLSPTSFPGLTNTGELLTLVNELGEVMHAVNYSLAWYHDAAKEDGGWTIEMINTKSPCSGISNWKASTDIKGGTPGAINSADGGTPDATGPKLLSVSVTDPTHITLYYDETLDSLKAATIANYSITGGITVASAVGVGPLFDAVNITLGTALSTGVAYTITAASAITDCLGNAIGANNTANIFLPSPAARFDLVVNEILFNPLPSINAEPPGVDYVEIYNRSNKVIDLGKVYITNRSSTTGKVGTLVKISSTGRLIQPGEFIVVTEDPAVVQRDFDVKNAAAFITLSSMPSYSDDKGFVIICDIDTNIIDEIRYTEKWHFKLIDNRENVSLERINYNDTSLVQSEQERNWHSAAKSLYPGFGTPTYKNSQNGADQLVQGEVSISPAVFSPDNDGRDDVATVNYSFPTPGYVGNITIFDAAGRPVRYLQKNALLGMTGFFRWDGLGDKGQQLAVGIYVIYTEVFNLQGKKKSFKTPIVLARQ
ncbi:lamin tail domain-containing protein [Ferruginibacter sp. SUN002]|uniref:lamin tail domain-containing protein n=1 Tax=Ferruginibacter sp. SUN002 TaxID=2937789 RepID=UPI003D360BF4